MKTDLTKRDSTKYCEFHRDHGHQTYDCIQLRKEIEYLIRRGHLHRFVALKGCGQASPPLPRQPTPAQHQQPLGEIQVISGGFARGGESSSARKAHLRSIRSGETLEIQAVRAGNWPGRAGLDRANSGQGQNRAGPKLARFFRAKFLTAQPALKTGPVGPNSILKAKKIREGRAGPGRAILGRAKFGPIFFGPII